MQPEDTPRAASTAVGIYGTDSKNEVLCRELALDGFDVRLATDPWEIDGVDLVVFADASERGAALTALRALSLGELAGSGARALWMSASGDTTDVLRAFEAGADDVIRAPFVYAELLARVRALLRRDRPPTVIRYGPVEIDTATRAVTVGSTPVKLRPLEYCLLVQLARDPSRVHTKSELLRHVWGYETGTTRTVDTHASRLRRALAKAGAEGLMASTWGVGYRLAPNSQARCT